MVRCTVSSFSNHASVLISVSCLGLGLSHVLLNMGVGYLNYIRKKMGTVFIRISAQLRISAHLE